MLVDMGNKPSNPHALFQVIARIYSEKENEYVKAWIGGVFPADYEKALEFWDEWEPPKQEIENTMQYRRENLHDYSHHELEISIATNDIYEESTLAFMNSTLDGEHEKE